MKQQFYYISLAVLLCLATFTACSDFLEIEPRNEIIFEQFWNEKTDVDNIVAGCYSKLQEYGSVSRMMAWGEFRSENVNSTGTAEEKDLNMHRLLVENINASNPYTGWDPFYNVINRCNTVIFYAPSVAKKDPSYTVSELRATIAEVTALRALCYFYLIRTFRDVPYSTQPFIDDDQVMDLPATPFNQVLDSLINDLESVQNDAVRRFPVTTVTKMYYQTGRITQDAIHAMLCEMYLWKKDYANCIKYADMVIESKQMFAKEEEGTLLNDMQQRFNGYPLLRENYTTTEFGRSYNSIFGTGNSSESVFELTFMQNDNMLANSAVSQLYGNLDGTLIYYVKPSDYVGVDQTNGVPAIFINKYDARAYEALHKMSATSSNICKYIYQRVSIIYEANASTPQLSWIGLYSKNLNHSNWIIYRLSDIMLLKAEALVQMLTDDGSDADTQRRTEAFTLVNAVNKRSICKTTLSDKDTLHVADYSTKALIEELVMKERQRELLFEGKRWYDLVRRSLRDGNTLYLRKQVAQKGLDNSSIVSSKLARIEAIFLPYYIEEMKVNPNLVQNPAFGSGEDDSIEKTATGN